MALETEVTSTNSNIAWPNRPPPTQDACYESLAPLYNQSKPDIFGDHMAFVVSCTKNAEFWPKCECCVQKLEVTASPRFRDAKISVTHEVSPKLGICQKIITVNKALRVAGFDDGSVVPIYNFGYKKTFNFDARGKLKHLQSGVTSLACCSQGLKLATGSSDGEIVLFHAREEDIYFHAKERIACDTRISGLAYFQPSEDVPYRPHDDTILTGENLLVFSTSRGAVGVIDARCKLCQQLNGMQIPTTLPKQDITAMCLTNRLPGHRVFFGSSEGTVMSIDMRLPQRNLVEQKLPGDSYIYRMSEVVVPPDADGSRKTFIAYTNGTEEIRILDADTLKPDPRWTCDRMPEGNQRDICQVDERLISCGEKASIGCWVWDAADDGINSSNVMDVNVD